MLLLFLLVVSVAHAKWSDIREGLDQRAALQFAGIPLMQCRVRSGALETWTYDDGGYILFANGRILYWQAPRQQKE